MTGDKADPSRDIALTHQPRGQDIGEDAAQQAEPPILDVKWRT
jgi:hypothetical protein